MTPQERAEKICRIIIHNWTPDPGDDRLQMIFAQIEEAVAEAKRDKQEFYDQSVRDHYNEGRADAYEDAAKIAETLLDDGKLTHRGTNAARYHAGQLIAQEIRARAKQVSK